MKKPILIAVLGVTLVLAGSVYAANGKPFQALLGLIMGLDVRVTALESAAPGAGAQKMVIAGSLNLESDGDEIRETFSPSGTRLVSHFAVFSLPDLDMQNPPATTLYRRKRTELPQAPINPDEFVMARFANEPDSNVTQLMFAPGRILLQFRREFYDPDGNLLGVSYGLDGPGGSGDYRLVLIR